MRAERGSGNVEVRNVTRPNLSSGQMVCVEADTDTQLTPESWDELVRDVNELLGRSEDGSGDH